MLDKKIFQLQNRPGEYLGVHQYIPGGSAKLTVYPDAGHNAREKAFAEDKL